jgi:CheY-like chemotaxis protein
MKRVLLAEDDPFISDIYANQLRRRGYIVDIAKNGQVVLEKIKNNFPELLILDIHFNNASGQEIKPNGWEILKIIRSDPVVKDLKVIVISNEPREGNIKNISELGVLDYFVKIESSPEDITNFTNKILDI